MQAEPQGGLVIAFVAGLSDKKLAQKLEPLAALEEVARIDLYRRTPFRHPKVRSICPPRLLAALPGFNDLYRLARLLLAGWRYHLIIGCHQRFHGLHACIAGSLWRVPVLQMVISSVPWVLSFRPYRYVVMRASAVAVRGPVSRDELQAHGYRRCIEVLHNPLPSRPAQGHAGFGDRHWHVIAVGDEAHAKDYPRMLEVLAALHRLLPALRVLMVGRGLQSAHGARARELGLGEAIRFTGAVHGEVLDGLYRDSRVLLMTSRREGLPMVAVEALQQGTPVLAPPVGEVPWLAAQGRAVSLLPETPARAAALLLPLIDHPSHWLTASTEALTLFDRLAADFALPAVSASWRRLLQGALA